MIARAAYSMVPALEARRATYDGPDRSPVERVSLCADWGELLVLLGDTGSGTSTPLALFAGLVAPTRGLIATGAHPEDTRAPWPRPDARIIASGDRAAMCALGRPGPHVLLLERPLDRGGALAGRRLLAACRRRANAGDAVVITTTDPEVALAADTTVALLVGGRLAAWGDKAVVRERV